MGDEYEPYQWQIGDPEGYGDDVGVPDYPYLDYINKGRGDEEDDPYKPPKRRNDKLYRRAISLERECKFDEALDVINQALEISPNDPRYLNVKAIILDNSGFYQHALIYYDKSLKIRNDSVVRGNKAQCLYRMAESDYCKRSNYPKQLDLINKALATLPDDLDRNLYLELKANILEKMGRKIQARKCNLLASKSFDEIKKIEEKEWVLKNPDETFINIVGTKFHEGSAPFKPDVILDLIKEPENEWDPDAIRVEIDGKTVGYVANSTRTLAESIKSATDIKDKFDHKTKAKFLFPFLDYMKIAKLI